MTDGIQVLYVDDEPVLLDVGKQYLEEGGEFSVDTAESAVRALELLGKKTYDAIVSDYEMPEMDGIQFLKKVRAADTVVPFIIFTGRGRESVVIEALNNGATFYLPKGTDADTLYMELAHMIRQAVMMRRAQAAYADQEQRVHDLQNATDLIQSVGPDGRLIFVNRKWLDTLGYREDEVAGLSVFEIIHPDSLKHCMDIFRRVTAGENVGIIDAVFRTREGKQVFVEGMTSGKLVDGICQYTRGIFKDVSDRKLAEAALRESEERYRSVVEDQTEFIARFRPDGTYVFANEAYCRFFNTPREKIIGTKYVPNIPREDLPAIARHLASLTRDRPVATLTNRVIMAGGSVRWNHWSNRAIFDAEGRLVEYLSVGRDITDLKEAEQELRRKNEELGQAFRALSATEEEIRHNFEEMTRKEQALRESEETFRAIVEQSGEGIVIVDLSGFLQVANRRAWEIFEYPGEVRRTGSLNIFELVAPDQRQSAVRQFQDVAQGKESNAITYKVITFRKNDRWIECIGKKIPYRGIPAMLISFRDITERRLVDEGLRDSEHKFSTVFRSNPVALILVALSDGVFIDVNDAFLQGTGYTRTEVIGRTSHELGFFPEESEVEGFMSALREKHSVEGQELHCRLRSGDVRICRFTAQVVLMGNEPHILSSIQDVTEQKATESALRALGTGMVGTTGLEALDRMAESIRTWLGADCIMIGELTPDREQVQVLSMLLDGEKIRDFTYTLRGSPCECTAEKGFCVFADNVAELFPESRPLLKLDIRSYAGTPLRNESGEVIGILCILLRRPITLPPSAREILDTIAAKAAAEIGRMNAEAKLMESEEKFRTMFALSPYPITINSVPEDRFLVVNRAFLTSGGYSEEEVLGKSPSELGLISVSDNAKLGSRMLISGKLENVPLTMTGKGGKRMHVLFSSVPVTIRNKPAVMTMTVEITKMKQIERELLQKHDALMESEEKFRKIFSDSGLGIALVLPDFRFQLVNPAWVAMLGYTEKELQGMTIREIIHPDDLEGDAEKIRDLGDGVIPVYRTEKRYVKKDGSALWGSLTITTIKNLQGDLQYYLAQVEDITPRKQAEAALRQANKQLTILSSVTRHDIKNHLLALDGYVQMLHKKIPGPGFEPQFSRITEISRQIADMIQFTKEYEKIGLHAPVWNNLRELLEAAGKNQALGTIALRNDLPEHAEILADPLVSKVFFNLIDNALRHGGPMTKIRFSLVPCGPDQVIVCEDNGHGVAAENKERIFERGFGNNTGYGLAISRDILEITGITIQETGTPGKGARFEIRVPRAKYRSNVP